LLVGLLILLAGLANYISSNGSRNSAVWAGRVSVIERSLALERARSLGEREYTFTTNFIPGIGVINDPGIFLQGWKDGVNRSD